MSTFLIKKSYTTNQITNNVKKYDVSNHDINIVNNNDNNTYKK